MFVTYITIITLLYIPTRRTSNLKNEDPFHMGVEEFSRILDHLVADHGGELDLVNFTGGEPTVHPHFLDFLEMAKRSEEHTSELQSRENLVCRLLLVKKKKNSI